MAYTRRGREALISLLTVKDSYEHVVHGSLLFRLCQLVVTMEKQKKTAILFGYYACHLVKAFWRIKT